MMRYVLFILFGYLSGSVLYSPLIARTLGVDILKTSDDQNPGGANVFKYVGWEAGLLAIACDILKAFAPVYLACHALDPMRLSFALVVCAPVLGHAFPVFSHFQGGKAIAAAFGATIGLFPYLRPFLLLACIYLIFTLVIVIEPHLIRSIFTFGLFAVACLLTVPCPGVAVGCALCGCLVILRHAMAYHGEKMRLSVLKHPE